MAFEPFTRPSEPSFGLPFKILRGEDVQLEDGHGLAAHHAHQPGEREAEVGARGAHGAREVLPALHGAGLPEPTVVTVIEIYLELYGIMIYT